MVQLPPPPAGVRDFALPDLFRRPIGPAGLEYSERARELGGQCVRVSGYIVEGRAATNGILLASAPVELHDDEDGLCDDLPANTVAVLVPAAALAGVVLPLHTPVLVTGKLELTTTEDPGGRRLFARVTVDDTMSTFVTPLATVLRSSTPSRLEAAPVPATTTITDLEGSHASR